MYAVDKEDTKKQLIEEFGHPKAYEKAVQMAATGAILGDIKGAELFAEIAKELMLAGHHSKGK